MGIGSFSQSELEVLKKCFGEIGSQLSQTEKTFAAKLGSLHATGGTILDEPALKKLFDVAKDELSKQQLKLNDLIEKFQKSTQAYEQKRQELYDKEEEIIARESQADTDFAAKREIQMAPLKRLREELDSKELYLVSMQNDFNENFKQRELKMLEDFKALNKKLQAAFDVHQAKAVQAQQELSDKENQLNTRETEVSRREADVRKGLSHERAQLLAEIDVIKHTLDEQDANFILQVQRHQANITKYERELGELATREASIFKRETQADADFAKKKEAMLAEVEDIRSACLENIKETEKKASEHRAKLLQETIQTLESERSRNLKALNESLQRIRADFENDQAKERQALKADQEQMATQIKAALAKSQELEKREANIKIKEKELKEEGDFLKEKERIVGEKFRKIADEQIKASVAEAQAVGQARDQIVAELVALRLKYEEQLSINNRFRNESASEVYAKIARLEEENNRLMLKVKNIEGQEKNHGKK